MPSPQGTAFKTQILTALRNDTFYNTIMLPYYRTPKGAALYENMFANANHSFPQYVDELQGMADAIGITLEEVTKWMMFSQPYKIVWSQIAENITVMYLSLMVCFLALNRQCSYCPIWGTIYFQGISLYWTVVDY